MRPIEHAIQIQLLAELNAKLGNMLIGFDGYQLKTKTEEAQASQLVREMRNRIATHVRMLHEYAGVTTISTVRQTPKDRAAARYWLKKLHIALHPKKTCNQK